MRLSPPACGNRAALRDFVVIPSFGAAALSLRAHNVLAPLVMKPLSSLPRGDDRDARLGRCGCA